ncbi:CLUMA_CG007842, isoform A [Clunio marinus]|uniref:CLUMA_CG007842, isoform A n=1 Tax=Clunio marinus TaxID=568069 RepID=A0A1J1I1V8_9DIPT|nr:CLUMA_CG007842, isoform A [Clunio marinus]
MPGLHNHLISRIDVHFRDLFCTIYSVNNLKFQLLPNPDKKNKNFHSTTINFFFINSKPLEVTT